MDIGKDSSAKEMAQQRVREDDRGNKIPVALRGRLPEDRGKHDIMLATVAAQITPTEQMIGTAP